MRFPEGTEEISVPQGIIQLRSVNGNQQVDQVTLFVSTQPLISQLTVHLSTSPLEGRMQTCMQILSFMESCMRGSFLSYLTPQSMLTDQHSWKRWDNEELHNVLGSSCGHKAWHDQEKAPSARLLLEEAGEEVSVPLSSQLFIEFTNGQVLSPLY